MICKNKECLNWEKEICNCCIHNQPKYEDFYQPYIPVCPKGYTDCVNDPAYIKFYDPSWYKKLYGDLDLSLAVKKSCSEEKCYYDDEDK